VWWRVPTFHLALHLPGSRPCGWPLPSGCSFWHERHGFSSTHVRHALTAVARTLFPPLAAPELAASVCPGHQCLRARTVPHGHALGAPATYAGGALPLVRLCASMGDSGCSAHHTPARGRLSPVTPARLRAWFGNTALRQSGAASRPSTRLCLIGLLWHGLHQMIRAFSPGAFSRCAVASMVLIGGSDHGRGCSGACMDLPGGRVRCLTT